MLADLHWLAFLLTGSREIATSIAKDAVASPGDHSFFSGWMVAWSRRLAIARTLASVRKDLSDSAGRTESPRGRWTDVPARSWPLPPDTTRLDLERALLSIDLFPRAALLLSLFEKVALADAAILLDAPPDLVRAGGIIGLRELTINLAKTSWTPARGMDVQYA